MTPPDPRPRAEPVAPPPPKPPEQVRAVIPPEVADLIGQAVGKVVSRYVGPQAARLLGTAVRAETGAAADAAGAGTRVAGARAAGAAAGGGEAAAAAGMGARAAAGAASAAGPVALAALAVFAAKEGIEAGTRAVTGAFETASDAAQKLAGNEGLELATGALEKAYDTIGGFSGVVGAGMKVFGVALREGAAAIEAFDQRARQLDGLSGQITTANAIAQNRKLLADLDEARRLGGEYAKVTDASSRIDTASQKLLTTVKEQLMPPATKALTKIADIAERALPLLERIAEGTSVGVKTTLEVWDKVTEQVPYFGMIYGGIKEAVKLLDKMTARQDEAEADNKLNKVMEDFQRITDSLTRNPIPTGPDPAAGAKSARVLPPIFQQWQG